MSETRFAMISDWMVNGNISSFLKVHPDTDRLELVGFSLPCLRFKATSQFTDTQATYLAERSHERPDLYS